MFNPSPLQSAIFTAIAEGSSNLLVEAVAGSGKTTTIVEGLKHVRTDSSLLCAPSIVFLAFNKSIAETLQTRVPRGVQCSTFHSLGFRALKNSDLVPRNVKVDGRKVPSLVWKRLSREDPDVQPTIKLVSLLKGQCEALDSTRIHSLIAHYDLDFSDLNKGIEVALKVLEQSNADLDSIDFDDMLYLPIQNVVPFSPQDWIFVDEVQDTNDIQTEILGRSGGDSQNCRVVAVGDKNQAIYGFRGANSDAMSRVASRFSCVSLPLDVSYRCPKSVVREAQKYLKHETL